MFTGDGWSSWRNEEMLVGTGWCTKEEDRNQNKTGMRWV